MCRNVVTLFKPADTNETLNMVFFIVGGTLLLIAFFLFIIVTFFVEKK